MSKRGLFNYAVLGWALTESGRSSAELAELIGVTEALVDEWVDGSDEPTPDEMRALGDALRMPVSLLVSSAVPATRPRPTLCTIGNAASSGWDVDALFKLRRLRRVQGLLDHVAEQIGRPAVEIPPIESPPHPLPTREAGEWIARDVKRGTGEGWGPETFKEWLAAFERRRIVVARLMLGPGRLGFAIPGRYAPLIAVNTSADLGNRIYALFHGLVHLAWEPRAASAPQELREQESHRYSLGSRLAREQGALEWFQPYSREASGFVLPWDTGDAPEPADLGAAASRLHEIGPIAAGIVLDGVARGQLNDHDARIYLNLDGREVELLAEMLPPHARTPDKTAAGATAPGSNAKEGKQR